jgi:hypothetical protein
VNELLVLLAAAAAGGGATLVAFHARNLAAGDGDSVGSIVLLLGMAAILLAGLRPGSSGSSDPAVLWLVAALLAPISASVFALLFVFLLGAFRRGFALRVRETSLMAGAAVLVIVLLLPIGGQAGDWLASGAGWMRKCRWRCLPRPPDRDRHPHRGQRRVRSRPGHDDNSQPPLAAGALGGPPAAPVLLLLLVWWSRRSSPEHRRARRPPGPVRVDQLRADPATSR